MSRFPAEEARIIALGREMADGLTANTAIYPAPPVDPPFIEAKMADYAAARETIVAAQGALKQALEAKDEVLKQLAEGMKKDLRYAENTVNFDDGKLKLIGWSGHRPKTPLALPGQVRDLHLPNQAEEAITLAWQKPADGGKLATYRVEWRESCNKDWLLAESLVETTLTLENQARGKTLEYRVVAMNKAGRGRPSNTVTIVL